MRLASPRSLFVIAFLGSALLIAIALYMEHVMGLAPCPLCIVQRICVIGFGLVCLVAAIHGPAKVGRRVYAAIAALFVAAGAATAIRQIWLQSVPADQLPSCLPSLEYMMEALPFQEIARLVLHGTAECAEVSWTMLGMSIPEWSLLGFIGMAIVCLWQLLRRD
ncbi:MULTISPECIES: disulfide bond formation protein B [Pseudomonadaceae]|jgi:disulfide bond formation protein DsbB|uniref:Disulfide bond formation protein B n=4 Tax=Bacteria TaxID=2 RepID=DSBB_STUS1|nr:MULTISPECIES: disulfide bond formation protein B [Pseudomonadaceae]A4VGY3.1 RecName: Full=Disulfide bond formation protein B; AltName: Full=Disulfide oxidoreductase [Stutzerimonas stutzeri A1501]EPL62782.1 disulfide bond formation protein [Stutzerimonas stutzeri B1SMN1]NMY63392.1 disulfide bond formation protein B [Pseudomonas sp. WS 5018]ABP78234.1 disulfide bond formation protein [Stutzerimonas stutzeri A1501]AEA82502.1 disulfide bond formation protein [Stutzerimonas stutzeri DSM 4166]AE